jgi:hypothetical protein
VHSATRVPSKSSGQAACPVPRVLFCSCPCCSDCQPIPWELGEGGRNAGAVSASTRGAVKKMIKVKAMYICRSPGKKSSYLLFYIAFCYYFYRFLYRVFGRFVTREVKKNGKKIKEFHMGS